MFPIAQSVSTSLGFGTTFVQKEVISLGSSPHSERQSLCRPLSVSIPGKKPGPLISDLYW
jgi:hypothetical protein